MPPPPWRYQCSLFGGLRLSDAQIYFPARDDISAQNQPPVGLPWHPTSHRTPISQSSVFPLAKLLIFLDNTVRQWRMISCNGPPSCAISPAPPRRGPWTGIHQPFRYDSLPLGRRCDDPWSFWLLFPRAPIRYVHPLHSPRISCDYSFLSKSIVRIKVVRWTFESQPK